MGGGWSGGVRAKEGGWELLVYGFYGLARGGTRYKTKPEFPDPFFFFFFCFNAGAFVDKPTHLLGPGRVHTHTRARAHTHAHTCTRRMKEEEGEKEMEFSLKEAVNNGIN